MVRLAEVPMDDMGLFVEDVAVLACKDCGTHLEVVRDINHKSKWFVGCPNCHKIGWEIVDGIETANPVA